MKIAVFPGSFDPITLGHYDIIERASRLFDKIIIAIGQNSQKKYMFSLEQRKVFIKNTFEKFPNVEVEEATKIVLNRKLFGSKSVFYISQDFFDALLYCNEEFKNSIEAKKIKTIEFQPIEEVIEYLDDTYSLELSDTEFIIEQ